MLLFDSIAASDPKLFQNPFSLCLPLLANSKFALLRICSKSRQNRRSKWVLKQLLEVE
jgi:hypothetical protein